jgi:hypothetical protein
MIRVTIKVSQAEAGLGFKALNKIEPPVNLRRLAGEAMSGGSPGHGGD